jgi:hypothetical protein
MPPTEPDIQPNDRPDARPDARPARNAPRRFRFEPAGGLVAAQVRKVGEARGFAVARLLTHWAEVAGPELSRMCRPQRVSYARKGFGATLVVETPGAAAPLVAMRLDGLRERINAVYGYAAIARIQLVQGSGLTALAGMAEAPAAFDGPGARLRSNNLALPSAAGLSRARGVVETLTEGVADAGLKAALDRLAQNVLDRRATPAVRNDRKEQ